MTYEYTVEIQDAGGTEAIDLIKKAVILHRAICFYDGYGKLLIKDPELPNSWNYDISVAGQDQKLHLSIVGWNNNLYRIFKFAMKDINYKIIDDDDEEISLEEVFRKQ
ncbi:hypothetical protein [Paracidovorax avenae]|uniref:hypothetical protein n=1 Tax=Paracidovorax avenae TaxID=80867 RepID=UPI0012600EB0|nr:hypothetical protein [Paracidovorax avenae]